MRVRAKFDRRARILWAIAFLLAGTIALAQFIGSDPPNEPLHPVVDFEVVE